ncbi:hypothetical protein KIN20_029536 [Parelaphostrongylus tenuis]|uniref:Uncharacterized protein n=1 Tax=Parelaphostrongylus tenuis TaxID=148309 RepID=A0AAD5R2S4_PARTN|nr:hypothetical protein KIN20_029536 [Parelaphostrongylus tenuis]
MISWSSSLILTPIQVKTRTVLPPVWPRQQFNGIWRIFALPPVLVAEKKCDPMSAMPTFERLINLL